MQQWTASYQNFLNRTLPYSNPILARLQMQSYPKVSDWSFTWRVILIAYGTATVQPRESFREIAVKVHIRRPEKDSWVYLGRALVSQEVVGQASRVGTCRDWFHFEATDLDRVNSCSRRTVTKDHRNF